MIAGGITHERTRNYLRQIGGTAGWRLGAVIFTFWTLPLSIDYLGEERFGVWATLLTLVSWMVLFDLGVGNGLRNKVAELRARDLLENARPYISSSYTWMSVVCIGVASILMLLSCYIPWQTVFNTQVVSEAHLRTAVQVLVAFFVLNFVVGLVSPLLQAIQKSSYVTMGQFLVNAMVLMWLLILVEYTNASLVGLAFAYGISMVVSSALLSVWLFRSLPTIRPTLSTDVVPMKAVLFVGTRFFIIQLAALVIFATDKFLIAQIFGPKHVVQYEAVFKVLSLVTLAHGFASGPLWSAYTDAYFRDDMAWIRDMLRKQLMLFFGVVLLAIFLALMSRSIVELWLGGNVHVSPSLVISMAAFVVIGAWNNVYAMMVNGLGKIRVQFYASIIAMVINIPLSVFLAKYTQLGLSGIVVGTCLSLSIAALALPVQVYIMLGSVKSGEDDES